MFLIQYCSASFQLAGFQAGSLNYINTGTTLFTEYTQKHTLGYIEKTFRITTKLESLMIFLKKMLKFAEKIEKKIKYRFKNKMLLKEALTHRSFTTENNINYDNQRLEFLGDAVVQIIITDYIYKKYKEKNEGDLTAIRSALVKRESLAELAKYLNLEEYILLGKGETVAGGNKRDSVLCDAFEALMGAIYLDSGIEACSKLLLRLVKEVFPDINSITENLNPKGYLQEITQKRYSEKPVYKVKESYGLEHNLTYLIEVSLNNKVLAIGKGKNIKAAERSAAEDAIKKLASKNNRSRN